MSHPGFSSEFLDRNDDIWTAPVNVIATHEVQQTKSQLLVMEKQAIWSKVNKAIISDGIKRPIGLERAIFRNLNSSVMVERGRQSLKLPECGFCKNNGHDFDHTLKDKLGWVVCPRLRKYICPKCHQTGKNAHTIKYCPMIENGEPMFQHRKY